MNLSKVILHFAIAEESTASDYSEHMMVQKKFLGAFWLDFLIEDAKNHLQTWGSKPLTFMLCNRNLTKGLTMNPEKTMYYTNGPDGKQRLTGGPELP